MIFQNDLNLKIRWKYDARTTRCIIQKRGDDISFIGVAECSINDMFVKETGRKLSLARALKETDLSKEERRTIWETYLNRKENA